MLRIAGLRKNFPVGRGQVHALQDVSFDVAEGEFFTLLGPSGSGKSTALRCVAGLERPEAGEIYIDDICVFSAERGIAIPPDERPIGMVFQSYAIWPHRNVFENVAFPLLCGTKGRRAPQDEIRAAVLEALRLVEMEAYAERPSTQLSGGQQQRVALARALVRRPKLLLLDEPLSNLDAKLRESMRVELKELTRAVGITSFFVTHDQLEALAMSERIAIIMEGQLVEIGSPLEVYVHTRDHRVATFLGTANTVRGRVVQIGENPQIDTPMGPLFVEYTNGLALAADTAVAIRPEAMLCTRERPGDATNTFRGLIRRATFLGSFVEGEVQIGEALLRVNLSPYDGFAAGEEIYVHVPRDRCQVVT